MSIPPSKPLSQAQLQILSYAATRPGGMVLPLPTELRARGAARNRLLTTLLAQHLIEERPTRHPEHSYRQSDAGKPIALRLTAAGAKAARPPLAPRIATASTFRWASSGR